MDSASAESIYNYFYEQYNYLEIPDSGTLLVERYNSEKNYLIFHSMYGRRVNDALSRAIGFLLGRAGGRDVEMGINDNSFYVAGEKMNIEKVMNFLKPENLEEILKEAIEKTDVLARRFRHCATRSLMILRNYKGCKEFCWKTADEIPFHNFCSKKNIRRISNTARSKKRSS